jgi:hypothetical protein
MHINGKKLDIRNKLNKITIMLLVIFLVGCAPRISNVSKIEIYTIDYSSTPNTSILKNSSVDKTIIKIIMNLINNAKKMNIKLDESIFDKYFLIESEGINRKIYFVLYNNSIDGYFHFENEKKFYQFKSKDVKGLLDSGFDF